MCGRIACALATDDLSCATACKSKQGYKYIKTNTHKSVLKFNPSYNVPPTASVPIVISAQHKHFQNSDNEYDKETDRLLVLMRFGIIPHWLKPENVKSYNHETHLCKIERLRESKLYNPLYEKGYRCAVPCVGYYEWQSTKSTKQPYFFYNKNNDSTNLLSKKGSFQMEDGWTGVQLLFLAGVFNVYTDISGNPAYSFAIITQEAAKEWQWVHHRTPVILQSDNDVNKWIKCDASLESVFNILQKPIENLATYPVDKTIVNKTKNSISTCIVPIDLNKPTNKLMSSWLSSAPKNNTDANKVEQKKETENKKKRTTLDSWLGSANKKPKKE